MPGSGNCGFNDLWLKKPEYKEWLMRSADRKAECHATCAGRLLMWVIWERRLFHDLIWTVKNIKTSWRIEENQHYYLHDVTLDLLQLLTPVPTPLALLPQLLSTTTRPTTGTVKPASAPPQQSLNTFITRNDTLSAEIVWCLHIVSSHSSYRSCEGTDKLFQKMFPDSLVAQGFGCGESKCARLARWGIAPHFKSLLTTNVNHADNFVLLFDESLNFENQKKQLDMGLSTLMCKKCDIHVRF